MNRGGAENALMNYYRHVDRNCMYGPVIHNG